MMASVKMFCIKWEFPRLEYRFNGKAYDSNNIFRCITTFEQYTLLHLFNQLHLKL